MWTLRHTQHVAILVLLAMLSTTPVLAEAALKRGASAIVLGAGGEAIHLRSSPSNAYRRVGQVEDGTKLQVLADARHADGTRWYRVAVRSDDADRQKPLKGWIEQPPLVSPVPKAYPARPLRSFTATVTGYAPGAGGGWITATGSRVRRGVVAVDPRHIPLGSLLTIEGLPGSYVAEDTGSAVRGAMVDVWFPDESTAVNWGVQKRDVRVFREGW